MSVCCGGKNAGKPISILRYNLGLFACLWGYIILRILISLSYLKTEKYNKIIDFFNAQSRDLWFEIKDKKDIIIKN